MFLLAQKNWRLGILGVAIFLSACSGGGSDSSSSPPPSSTPSLSLSGTAAFSGFETFLPMEQVGTSVRVKDRNTLFIDLEISAFDSQSNEPVRLHDLVSTAYNIGSNAINLSGTIDVAASPFSCSVNPNRLSAFDALMLFDRSGSMRENDKNNLTLAAGREFINLMAGGDRGSVAEFTSATNGLNIKVANLTSDQVVLTSAVNDIIDPPIGGTPLWDSIVDYLTTMTNQFINSRAMIVFSDGEDEKSIKFSRRDAAQTVFDSAVDVYVVNLRNSNSQFLDELAYDSGGAVFSTTQVEFLNAYARSLEPRIRGDYITCSTRLSLSINPTSDSAYDVGFGGSGTSQFETQFEYAFDGHSGIAINDVVIPYKLGIRAGNGALLKSNYGFPILTDSILTSDFLEYEGNNYSKCLKAIRMPNNMVDSNGNILKYIGVQNACNGAVSVTACNELGSCYTDTLEGVNKNGELDTYYSMRGNIVAAAACPEGHFAIGATNLAQPPNMNLVHWNLYAHGSSHFCIAPPLPEAGLSHPDRFSSLNIIDVSLPATRDPIDSGELPQLGVLIAPNFRRN